MSYELTVLTNNENTKEIDGTGMATFAAMRKERGMGVEAWFHTDPRLLIYTLQ